MAVGRLQHEQPSSGQRTRGRIKRAEISWQNLRAEPLANAQGSVGAPLTAQAPCVTGMLPKGQGSHRNQGAEPQLVHQNLMLAGVCNPQDSCKGWS